MAKVSIEYLNDVRFMDRSTWISGAWDTEQDIHRWQDEATGLHCVLRRGPSGAWCGYVGLPPSHPLHGKSYDDPEVEVHGGLTYAEACVEEPDMVCHAGPEVLWWFGFDCAHAYDFTPAHSGRGGAFLQTREEVYRDVDYARAETLSLARQLAAVPA